jgi:hypothetical protein
VSERQGNELELGEGGRAGRAMGARGELGRLGSSSKGRAGLCLPVGLGDSQGTTCYPVPGQPESNDP